MKIVIDIGHPAHFHYFKNFIIEMGQKNHDFLIFARNKDVVHALLKNSSIKFINRGKGLDSKIGKVFYMIYASVFISIRSLFFKSNIFVSFGSPYAAQAAFILRKPHVSLNDTEHVDGKKEACLRMTVRNRLAGGRGRG